jgi:hypothetical protein
MTWQARAHKVRLIPISPPSQLAASTIAGQAISIGSDAI